MGAGAASLHALGGCTGDANDSRGRRRTRVLPTALRAPAVPQIDLTYSTWLLPISIGFQVGRAGQAGLAGLHTDVGPECLHQAAGSRPRAPPVHRCLCPPLHRGRCRTLTGPGPASWIWWPAHSLPPSWCWASTPGKLAGGGNWWRAVPAHCSGRVSLHVVSLHVGGNRAAGASHPCLAVVPCYCAACSDAAFSFYPTLPTATACPMPGRRGRCGAAGRWRATICCTAPSCKTC